MEFSEQIADLSLISRWKNFPQRGPRWTVLPFLAGEKALQRLCRKGHGKKIFFSKF